MKFTTNVKPLKDALDLGVISQNISKFYQKSCLAKITATKNSLKINLEAAYIVTELRLHGSGNEDVTVSKFVDCSVLKDLVGTLTDALVEIEFIDGGIILHSGKSNLTLPQLVEGDELDLTAPSAIDSSASVVDLNKNDWKFVSDHQMFAIAMSFIHPVYTKVWIGENGDILVGDFDNSIFTHSKKNKLNSTCLLSDTIINLFNTLPEGSKLIKLDNSYIVNVKTDAYEYISEFTPQHEEDEGVGEYHSEIILPMLVSESSDAVKANIATINRYLNQSALLSGKSEDVITVTIENNEITLKDNNIDCSLQVEGTVSEKYDLSFKTALLKTLLNNLDEETVVVQPNKQDDGTVVGLTFKTSNMEATIASVEE